MPGRYQISDFVDPKVERPLLKAMRDGEMPSVTPEQVMRVIAEATPVMRHWRGPAVPPNPRGLPWLVIGGAKCVRDDINSAPTTGPRIAVNRAVLDFDHDLAVTLHPEITRAMAERDSRVICPTATDWVTDVIDAPAPWNFGTSALYAVRVAFALGADRVVLAGCPVDDTTHYHRRSRAPALGPPEALRGYRRAWVQVKPAIGDVVRSMSGFTRELFGAPPWR